MRTAEPSDISFAFGRIVLPHVLHAHERAMASSLRRWAPTLTVLDLPSSLARPLRRGLLVWLVVGYLHVILSRIARRIDTQTLRAESLAAVRAPHLAGAPA